MALRRALLALLAASTLGAGPALAQPAAPAPSQLYLFLYQAGPAWQAGKPMTQQALSGHGPYIQSLLADGRLFAAGPNIGFDGGMAIVRAANLDEAKAMLAADPAIKSGVFTAEVRAWLPAYISKEPLRR